MKNCHTVIHDAPFSFSRTTAWLNNCKCYYFNGYQSTRHTVKSSHGHLVTRLTRHRSTRHIRVSSRSQLVTSEHTTKPSAAGEIVPRNSAHCSIWTVCRQVDMQEGVTENKWPEEFLTNC